MQEKSEIVNLIASKIIHSPKYRSLYPETINRIVKSCLLKYPPKIAEKEARNLLHQIWSAYYFGYFGRPKFDKILLEIKTAIKDGLPIKDALSPVLELHSSTRERKPIVELFYKEIFKITGNPQSIIDWACGLNPLTILWMGLPKDARYAAYDIDSEEIEFLNDVFSLLKIKNAKAAIEDLFFGPPKEADIVFMFKVLPLLEKQQRGSAVEIMAKQKCRFLVVSFPVKSISGKERGMADFYSEQFEKSAEALRWRFKKLPFSQEIVFVVKKK
jgi:16S rRNA (guanine(1405)-N(7))-methyltransferase